MILKKNNFGHEEIDNLANELGTSKFVAEVLLTRGLNSKEEVENFNNFSLDKLVDVYSYTGMEQAVERIKEAIKLEQRIAIYGDYDCDGVCSVSILYKYLRKQNVEVAYYIPNRTDEGYGLHNESLENIAEKFYPDLIITVDCGISSYKEVEYAKDVLGIDMIITDHHQLQTMIPECIVINPQIDKETTFPHYCGAGVALRLVEALEGSRDILDEYLSIAAIATVADMVPLVEDNRVIVKLGLDRINKGLDLGIDMLASSCSTKGKVNAATIGFQLAPRINALGRLGDANDAVNLFVSDEAYILKHLVEKLNVINKERQDLTEDLAKHCNEIISRDKMQNDRFLILYNRYWSSGVLGIVCSRLVQQYNRPVILLSEEDGILKGSGRSVDGVNIFEVVSHAIDTLIAFGGHAMACGLSLDESNFSDFKKRINEYMENVYPNDIYVKDYKYDVEVDPENITIQDVEYLKKLEPFGMGNPKIKYLLKKDSGEFKQLSTTQHIKESSDKISTLLFNKKDSMWALNTNMSRQYLGGIQVSMFNGMNNIDFLPSDILMSIDENINKIQEDEELSRFISGLMRIEPTGLKTINLENVENAIDYIKDNMFSTVYIAYFKSTYLEFIDMVKNKGFIDNLICESLHIVESSIPYNRIILDPQGDIDLSSYENIIFLDTPLSMQNIKMLNYSDKSAIFTINNSSDIIRDNIKKHMILRSDFGPLYIKMKKILESNRIESFQSLYEEYKKDGGELSQTSLYIPIYTFFELGIFKMKGSRIIVDPTIKTSLDKSEFLDNLESYILTKEGDVI